jgi:hypothetical protein
MFGTVTPRNLTTKFFPTLYSRTTFHLYDSYRNTRCSTVYRTISIYTQPQPALNTVWNSCTVVWIILAAVAASAWRWVMQFLPGAGKWQLRSPYQQTHCSYMYRESNLCFDRPAGNLFARAGPLLPAKPLLIRPMLATLLVVLETRTLCTKKSSAWNFLSPIPEVMQPYSWRHNSSYS